MWIVPEMDDVTHGYVFISSLSGIYFISSVIHLVLYIVKINATVYTHKHTHIINMISADSHTHIE